MAVKSLVQIIREQTEILFTNLNSQIEQADLEAELDGLPNSRYLFHTIHSADRWFINPDDYTAPGIDITGVDEALAVIDEKRPGYQRAPGVHISREQLARYAGYVHDKTMAYIESLTDDMLQEIVPASHPYTRLHLILSQFRHFMYHLGMSEAVTVKAGKPWPDYSGFKWPSVKSISKN